MKNCPERNGAKTGGKNGVWWLFLPGEMDLLMDTLGISWLCSKELWDKALPGAQGNLAVLSCSLGNLCQLCPAARASPKSSSSSQPAFLHPQSRILTKGCPPHPAASAAASLCLQQPTIHGGSCGTSLADKLYGNLSSLLALSLEVQHSWFRWILACWAVLQREAERFCWSGLLLGTSAVFKSLYFAQPHRVWFVMVSMEGVFIAPLWRCISSPSQQHLAQG